MKCSSKDGYALKSTRPVFVLGLVHKWEIQAKTSVLTIN